MKQGQIHYYTAGQISRDCVLQSNDYYTLTASIEQYQPGEYQFRLTKTIDDFSSYQEFYLTRDELLKLQEHIDDVTR